MARLEQSSGSETDSDQETTSLLAGSSTGEWNGVVAGWSVGGWGSSAVWLGDHGGGWASRAHSWGGWNTASWGGWGWVDGNHGCDVGWHAGGDDLGGDHWWGNNRSGADWGRNNDDWCRGDGAARASWASGNWGRKGDDRGLASADWGRQSDDSGVDRRGLGSDWAVGDRWWARRDGVHVGRGNCLGGWWWGGLGGWWGRSWSAGADWAVGGGQVDLSGDLSDLGRAVGDSWGARAN
jgi:hypothetical protein